MRFSFFLLLITSLVSCSVSKKATVDPKIPVTGLRFIDLYVIPNGIRVDTMVLGGLSSIDYDVQKDQYYFIADDPGALSPTRFFTAKIVLSHVGIDTILFTQATALKNAEGQLYADIRKDRTHSLDAESMRYHPGKNEFFIGSEGQRFFNGKDMLVEDPGVYIHRADGTLKDSFQLADDMHINAVEKGLRHNTGFEAMSFADNYTHLYVGVEGPGYDDGPVAGLGDSTAWTRINKFDVKTRKLVSQFAYKLDALRHDATPTGAFKINGMTDILSIGDQQFLVLERGYSTGVPSNDVRVYIADEKGAEDISKIPSLINYTPRAFSKKLLFDFASIGQTIDNVEGMTFGPTLPNGHRTLLFVVDNDFMQRRPQQVFLFEVIP